jgi:hydrogenase expression/formation protein HypC
MCLAIPGQVMSVEGTGARVSFSGVERMVQLDLVPGVATGDWVLVHAGFAIQKIDAQEAKETLDLLQQIEDSMASEGRG